MPALGVPKTPALTPTDSLDVGAGRGAEVVVVAVVAVLVAVKTEVDWFGAVLGSAKLWVVERQIATNAAGKNFL